MEAKKEDVKIALVERGLEVAITDSARAKLVRSACHIHHYAPPF